MATILNVAPSTTITTAWGNSVADELNIRVLKLAGGTMTGDLTLRNANPTADNHAARKKYVDDLVGHRVSDTGDVMTGSLQINENDSNHCLMLRSQQTGAGGSFTNTPYMSFYNNSATTRFGFIQGTPANLNIYSETGDISLNSGGGQVRTSDAIYCTGPSRFFGTYISVLGGDSAYTQFFANASNVDSIGSRSGYVGIVSGHMHLRNEGTNAHFYQACSGYMLFHTGAPASAGVTGLGPYERMRIDNVGSIMIGKTSSDLGVEGVTIWQNGSLYATKGAATGAAPLVVNRQSAADGNYMLHICRNESTVGRIEMEGTTGSKFVSGSDRRMKNILGPITDAIERVKAMSPYRVSWKADPTRGETDAFIADEMMDIVPEAVSGMPNAVTGPPEGEGDPPEGTPVMQGMSYEKLITVTVAALQNVIGRLETLEAA